ncbi:MAG: 23S rRNA (pseudouridine(1915)-N(3))-methyltransferase RlmH [Candidatus Aminicenantes bacterium]
MKLKVLWPGKTRNVDIKSLQDYYLRRINQIENCELIETKEVKGLSEKEGERIREIEAQGLEKHFKDDYIICLFDRGKEMNSEEFARFLEKTSMSSARAVTFVVGGFLGLAERVLERADTLLALSKMTFSHELSRIMVLEQIYRSLTIARGKQYAK